MLIWVSDGFHSECYVHFNNKHCRKLVKVGTNVIDVGPTDFHSRTRHEIGKISFKKKNKLKIIQGGARTHFIVFSFIPEIKKPIVFI